MQLQIYSIRDSKGECYNTPFFTRSHGEAERSFLELLRDPKSLPSKYPDDYDLYHLGEYNDANGELKPLDTPRHVHKAVNLLSANPTQ